MFHAHSVHNFVDNGNRSATRPMIREQKGEDLNQSPLPLPILDHKFPCVPWFPISAIEHANRLRIVQREPERAD